MDNYFYSSIDLAAGEIRLVRLLPGKFDDDIRLEIFHAVAPHPYPLPEVPDIAPLQDTLPAGWRVAETVDGNLIFVYNNERTSWTHPDPNFSYDKDEWRPPRKLEEGRTVFQALSYSWGPEEPQQVLYIASGNARSAPADPDEVSLQPQWKCLPSRDNLASALRNLRSETGTRVLWIDAICIDQANLEERGRHVSRMDSIFSAAASIVVWLGPESEDSAPAMRFLELMGRQMELLDSLSLPAPDAAHADWMKFLPLDQPTYRSIRSLLARSWFQRLWIWQEIVLGHKGATVQCGQETISWYHLRRGLVLLRETNLPLASMRDGLMANPLLYLPYCTIPYAKGLADGWSGLIHGTSLSECCDPKDRVYSLLGLCDSSLAAKLEVSYHFTHERVFSSFFRTFLEEYQSLILMRFCDLNTRQLDAPTWVPDLCNIVARPTQLTFASGNTAAVTSVSESGVLSALGVQATVVKTVSDFQMTGVPPTMLKAFECIENWYALGKEMSTDEDFPLAFFSALFFGWVSQRSLNADWIVPAEVDEDFHTHKAKGQALSEEDLGSSALMNHFFRDDRHHVFLVTEDGKMGTAPLGTNPGE